MKNVKAAKWQRIYEKFIKHDGTIKSECTKEELQIILNQEKLGNKEYDFGNAEKVIEENI